jgi:Protein of unknown function (DUF3048) N-terminal domain/Protein of unknown function (DUF3048) C-terminal domain
VRRWARGTLTLGLVAVLGCSVTVTPKTREGIASLSVSAPAPTVAPLLPSAAPTLEPSPVPTLVPTPEPTPALAPPAVAAVTGPAGAALAGRAATVSCPPPRPSLARHGFAGVNPAAPPLRPVVVQIDNAIPARPALNLGLAHTVFEYVAEGGVTRFSALYTADDPGTVGPIRSARLISMEVARQFEALLVYHGASSGVQDRIWNGGIYFMSFNTPDTAGFHSRLNNRPAPHNSIARLTDVRRYARSKGVPLNVDDWPDYPRGDVLAPPAGAASRVSVGFSGPDGAPWADYRADFRYAPDTGRYLRSTGGRPDIDAGTSQQISANTVVVQVAPVVVTDIIEDLFGSRSLDYQLHGEGKALYFRDGSYWEGCWRRDDPFGPTTFIGPDGTIFPLAKGQTWIAVAAPNTPIVRE